MQHLLTISVKEFQKEFYVNDDAGVDMFVTCIYEDEVNNVSELRMKASMAKYVEYSEITINFSDDFNLKDIPDDIVINMLNNVENRIQVIGGLKYFIIIHRISDNDTQVHDEW